MSDTLRGQTIVISGGSGFLGVSLAHHLAEAGAAVIILSRRPPVGDGPWSHVTWDGRTLGAWRHALNDAVGLVNLAGRSVNCIKTPDHQDEILRSRVESTRVLGEAMRSIKTPPAVWVQMITAHIYGDPPLLECNEDSPFGCGLAPFVGRAWEKALHEALLPSQRHVILRTGFVLGRNRGAGGGALQTLARLTRWGLGGKVASGKQGMSWIHEADMNRLFELALTDDTMCGPYIASGPNPTSQVDFMRTLRQVLRVPIGLPATRWMVRLGAHFLLRTDPDLVLYGRYVVSKRLANAGFQFLYPQLPQALEELLK